MGRKEVRDERHAITLQLSKYLLVEATIICAQKGLKRPLVLRRIRLCERPGRLVIWPGDKVRLRELRLLELRPRGHQVI